MAQLCTGSGGHRGRVRRRLPRPPGHPGARGGAAPRRHPGHPGRSRQRRGRDRRVRCAARGRAPQGRQAAGAGRIPRPPGARAAAPARRDGPGQEFLRQLPIWSRELRRQVRDLDREVTTAAVATSRTSCVPSRTRVMSSRTSTRWRRTSFSPRAGGSAVAAADGAAGQRARGPRGRPSRGERRPAARSVPALPHQCARGSTRRRCAVRGGDASHGRQPGAAWSMPPSWARWSPLQRLPARSAASGGYLVLEAEPLAPALRLGCPEPSARRPPRDPHRDPVESDPRTQLAWSHSPSRST